MAGGNFDTENKDRPGAYINFESIDKPSMGIGERGIVTFMLPLSWGENGKLIEVSNSELLNGESLAKIGFTAFDDESKIVREALRYCTTAKIFRADVDGTKATAESVGLTATAKYAGELGNSLTISVTEDGALFEVNTYLKGSLVDSQKVSSVADLKQNSYVVIEGTLSPTPGLPLSGGSNGDALEADNYPNYFRLLETAKWNTMGAATTDITIKASIEAFIKTQRNDEGKYVQAVVADYISSDYEGIINNINGATINSASFTKEEFAIVYAAITAGSNATKSNSGQVILGATAIDGQLKNSEIKKALQNGQLVLSPNQDGTIKVEQDINSYHSFTSKKNYVFGKNRIVRTLDEIGTSVKDIWESKYIGKVDNNEIGHKIFMSDLVSYCNNMQKIGAIQDFKGAEDIEIKIGDRLDSVVAKLWIKPVDSMEKLYLTVYLNT